MSHPVHVVHSAFLTALAAVCCSAAPTSVPVPDSWMPFSNKRVVAPSGKRYVVVRKKGQGIRFELCERRAGAGLIESAESSSVNLLGAVKKDISRDPKDRVIATGTYKQMPMGVQMADGLDGFLLFDKYANVGYGEVVTWIDGRGTTCFEHTLKDLFGAAPKGSMATVSSLWWSRSVWLDERAKSVVVLTTGGELREVAIPGGAITVPEDDRLLGWAMHGSAKGRASALEVIAEGPLPRCQKALPLVSGTLLDRSQPLSLRLRAGWIVARAGSDPSVAPLFLETVAGGEGISREDRAFAVRHLGEVLGDEALPVLRGLMRGTATDVWGDAYQAFGAIGESAVPTLIAMLGEAKESADYRGGAAHALAQICSPKAVPALRRAVQCGDNYVEGAARGALKQTFWKLVDAAWSKIPKDLARDDIDLETAAPCAQELRIFDKDWSLKQLNERIDRIDLRYSRYLERVRDGVDS